MAGADTVMLGSLFAGTEGARRGRQGRRDAVQAVARDGDDRRRRGPRRQGADVGADEGVEALTPYKGPVAIVAEEFCQGIRSGGCRTVAATRSNALATGQNSSASHPARRSARGSTPTTTGGGSAWTARRSESPTRTAKRRPKAATDYRAGSRKADSPRRQARGCERVTVCRSHGALLTPSGHPLRMPDAFGRAIRDHHRGDRTTPLRQGDGEETREHPIGGVLLRRVRRREQRGFVAHIAAFGPARRPRAGAGRHTRCGFQGRFETVAVETSPALVEAMRDRGVVDVREGDMFALRDAFERDRFASALAIGTQIGLAGSMRGLSAFLGDLAFVTTPGATAVIDSYDPDHPGAADLLGYREDPTPGSRIASCGSRTTGRRTRRSISGCSPPTGSAKRRSGRDGRSRRWTARGPETGPTTGPRSGSGRGAERAPDRGIARPTTPSAPRGRGRARGSRGTRGRR